MSQEPLFETVEVRIGRFRVDWSYDGEGVHGEYRADDPDDRPLLRFSCFLLLSPTAAMPLPRASYLTSLPIATHPDRLLVLSRRLIEILAEDWPHDYLPSEASGELPYQQRVLHVSYVDPDNFAISVPSPRAGWPLVS